MVLQDSPDFWKVSISTDENPKQKLQTLILSKELFSLASLSKIFSDMPEEGHLHIIVKAPPGGKCQCSTICAVAR